MIRTILKFALPALFVVASVGVAFRLVSTRPKAKRESPPKESVLVDVIKAQGGAQTFLVEAAG
ncbi:MAG TPA: hypothetical protein DCQ06_13375, partial [Myxococcales bacterium]|nr:hypothetical protein [Myxococcales bacterium]